MIGKRLLAGMVIASMLQGCSVARRELRHSGGYPGSVMDRRFFDASSSKELQLLRLTMVVALASRVGNATVQDGREAQAFLSYLRNATDEVNYLAGHLYGQAAAPAAGAAPATPSLYTCENLAAPVAPGPIPVPAPPCSTYQSLFEADLPQLEYKVARLVLAALPREQAAAFARSARSGNIAGAAWQFLKLAAASIDGLHRGAAAYRSSQEILAIVIAEAAGRAQAGQGQGPGHPDQNVQCADPGPAANGAGGGSRIVAPIRTVEGAVACLGLSSDRLFSNPLERTVVFPRQVPRDAFHALFEIIHTSCADMPLDLDLATTPGGAANPRSPATIETERREACATMRFIPTLRFGGRRL